MAALIEALKEHFRDRDDVYVSGNNFIYYVEGDPKRVFSPDVYVVVGVPKRQRRIYKLWEEEVAPCFVVEMSSRKTWLEDIGNKKALCARLGVREYYLYDPEGDVVRPPLQGFRLGEDGEYHRIPERLGVIESESLDLALYLDRRLRLHARDRATGDELLRPEQARAAMRDQRARAESQNQRAETEKQRADAEKQRAETEKQRAETEKQRAETEKQRAEAEKQRADAAEARLRELEAELAKRRG
jgi:Uma2 family endonuclease